MIVCVCEGVSDRVIRSSIREGASSVSELGRRCKVGQDCGRCRAMLRSLLGDSAQARTHECSAIETATR